MTGATSDERGRTPRVKAVSLLSRHRGISAQRFHLHWALVHRAHALRLEPIRRYVQFHREPGRLAPFPEAAVDAVAQVWYADLAGAAAMRTDPLWGELIAPDESYFLDGAGVGLLTQETTIIDGPVVGPVRSFTKGVLVLAGVPGARHPEVAAWCAATLPGLVAATVPGVGRATLSLPLPGYYRDTDPAFEGLLELWPVDAGSPDCGPLDLRGLGAAMQGSPLDPTRTTSLVGAEFLCVERDLEPS